MTVTDLFFVLGAVWTPTIAALVVVGLVHWSERRTGDARLIQISWQWFGLAARTTLIAAMVASGFVFGIYGADHLFMGGG